MCEELIGTWVLTESNSEAFDKYLEALGVGFVMRKAAGAVKPDVIISKNGEEWNIKTVSKFKTIDFTFKLDTEFEDNTQDGRKAKHIVTAENGGLKQVQKLDGKESTVTREIKGGRMVTTLSVGDVKCVRIFDRK